MQGKRILVVDDDPELPRLMQHIFAKTQARVFSATSGHEALRRLYTVKPDLVILDVMMPGLDGWEVCRQIREISHVPIIMLTALGQDKDVIYGLRCGADDYMVKPVSPEVLLARAQAVLRRSVSQTNGNSWVEYNDGYLMVDLAGHRVYVQREPVKLSATEYRLVAYLVENAGRVLTFEQILDNVWHDECCDRVEYVHVYISRLRRKLEPDPDCPQYLVSEHGIGYCFERQPPALSNNGQPAAQ